MSRYEKMRNAGHSHEYAVIFDCQSIVDEELNYLRSELEPAELHTLLANARQDISAITILLSHISARQQEARKWVVSANVFLFLLVLLVSVEVFFV